MPTDKPGDPSQSRHDAWKCSAASNNTAARRLSGVPVQTDDQVSPHSPGLIARCFSILVFGLLCWSVLSGHAAERPPTRVSVDTVRSDNTAPQTWTPGTIFSRSDARLGAEVEGVLVWIAEPGTHVELEEVVARVNDTLWRERLARGEAEVRATAKRLEYLRSEAARLQRLAAVDNAAQSQLEGRIADREEAEQTLLQARAEVNMNRYRLQKTQITAPFAGQVVERFVELGEYISTGTAAVRLVDLKHLEIRSQAPLRVAPFVSADMSIPIRSERGPGHARISAVIPVGDLTSRTFEIRLAPDDNGWVVGEPVQLGLPTAKASAMLTIPRDALVIRETGTAVFVVDAGAARRVQVETGVGAGSRIEIRTGGLEPGDQVVVAGAEMLRDGQAVKID
ncbi:MAG: efflux RND transporter periplasmic adaptor subunit [Pseudomonadota bacterium]